MSIKKNQTQDLTKGTEIEDSNGTDFVAPLQAMLDNIDDKLDALQKKLVAFDTLIVERDDLNRKRKEVTVMIDRMTGVTKQSTRAGKGENLRTISELLQATPGMKLSAIAKATGISVGSVRAALTQHPDTFTRDNNTMLYSLCAARKAA